MRQKKRTRLAILREQLGWTRQELAKRTGYSTVYLKKLEAGERAMTSRPASAIAVITGVHASWLRGRFREKPILAEFGVGAVAPPPPSSRPTQGRHKITVAPRIMPVWVHEWSPEMAERLQKRKLDSRAANEDAVRCLTTFLIHSNFLANIILTGYKAKKPMLALARIHAAIANLCREFKVPGSPLPPAYINRDVKRFDPLEADAVGGEIVNRLIRGLKAEIRSRP
jgi:transcriptional regulator with XRE-family HTH domain